MPVRFRYDEEHALLRDEARRCLAERVTPAALRRLAAEVRGASVRELAAADFRLPAAPKVPGLVMDLKQTLGKGYDVVAEPTHIHIEHDPQ